jgi:hypothetical protein
MCASGAVSIDHGKYMCSVPFGHSASAFIFAPYNLVEVLIHLNLLEAGPVSSTYVIALGYAFNLDIHQLPEAHMPRIISRVQVMQKFSQLKRAVT